MRYIFRTTDIRVRVHEFKIINDKTGEETATKKLYKNGRIAL